MAVFAFNKISSRRPIEVTKRQMFKAKVMTGLLLTACIGLPAQAAPVNKAATIETKASDGRGNSQLLNKVGPTADLRLISLQDNKNLAEGSTANLLATDDNENLTTPKSWTEDDIDSIDALGDNSSNPIIEESDYSYDDTPPEVATVSLKAISPETLKTFVAVVDLVRREYVEAVNDETLFDNAMSGMLTKLDNYAEFLDAEAYENLRAFTQGDVGDVGIKVAYQADIGHWVITEIVADSPAAKKGIRVGDYLHQIGEFKLDEDRQANDVKQLLTGIAGSQIDVIVSKEGRRKRAVTLQRNNAQTQTIETRLVEGIAIIKIPAFQDTTREKIVQSLIELKAPVTAVIIDVRDNPGGVLTSAVEVASLFMSDTEVVQVKARQGDARTLMTKGSAILEPLPVAIIQNRYSASAAEVLASSLQAKSRAIIVGETSYGKGSVQSVIALNDEQAVKLTVAHYLTANGVKIDEVGVEPDVTLSGSERSWEQQALDLLRPKIRNSGIRLVRKDSSEEQFAD